MRYNYVNHSAAVFCGFYESGLFNSDTIINATYGYDAPEGYEWDIKDFQAFMNEVSRRYVNSLYENLVDYDIIRDMDFVRVHSPKYYNYSTDKLEIIVDFDEEKLTEYCTETNREDFEKYLVKRYTSRSGFVSFVPTNIPELLDSEYVWDVLIEYYLLKNIDFEFLEINMVPEANEVLWENLSFYKDGKYYNYEYDSESDSYSVGKEI